MGPLGLEDDIAVAEPEGCGLTVTGWVGIKLSAAGTCGRAHRCH